MELYSLPGIPARMAADLRAAGLVTCDDMLRTSDVAVAAALRGSLHHAREVIGYVSGMAAPRPTTSLALAQRDRESRSTLPTGLPEVDAALRGGVPPSLTELCGPAGAGKTQACYTLAAAAASRPLLEGRDDADGVVWLDTEGAFSPDRLREVLVARHPALYGWDDGDEPAAADRARGRLADVLNHVVLFTPASLEELVDTLASPSMEATLSEARVRAIVVDSVAAVARRDYDGGKLGDMRRRTDLLARLSAALKVLADTFRLPVIVTNQVRGELGRERECVGVGARGVRPASTLSLLTAMPSPSPSRRVAGYHAHPAGGVFVICVVLLHRVRARGLHQRG